MLSDMTPSWYASTWLHLFSVFGDRSLKLKDQIQIIIIFYLEIFHIMYFYPIFPSPTPHRSFLYSYSLNFLNSLSFQKDKIENLYKDKDQ